MSTIATPRRSLRAKERATGKQLLAHRAGRRDEQQELAAPVRARRPPMCSGRPARSITSNCGAGWPTSTAVRVLSAPSGATRSCSTPIWRASAATGERQDHDHDPQDDLRDDQRLHRLSPPVLRPAGAETEQPPDRPVQKEQAAGGGGDRDPVERRQRPPGRRRRAASGRSPPAPGCARPAPS